MPTSFGEPAPIFDRLVRVANKNRFRLEANTELALNIRLDLRHHGENIPARGTAAIY